MTARKQPQPRIPPQNLEAEQAVLGAMMLTPEVVKGVLGLVTAADFYSPGHSHVFSAITGLHRTGQPVDHLTVTDALRKAGVLEAMGGEAVLVSVKANTPAASGWAHYAKIVAETSVLRRLIKVADSISEQAYGRPENVGDLLDSLRSELATVETPWVEEPDDVSWADFLSRTTTAPTPWIVKGLVREGYRTVIIGGEGQGKTWLTRAIAAGAACGLHPLAGLYSMEPMPVVLGDLENPDDHIHTTLSLLLRHADRINASRGRRIDPAGRLWHHPEGVDIRTRTGRAQFEGVLKRNKPKLVILGPLYKLYRTQHQENWEQVARDVQGIIDDWRTRYGFAVILEDHMPQTSGRGQREVRPYGSSFWLRWPEVGISLGKTKGRKDSLDLHRFRGDRVPVQWPDRIDRSKPWPWEGYWEHAHLMPTADSADPSPLDMTVKQVTTEDEPPPGDEDAPF